MELGENKMMSNRKLIQQQSNERLAQLNRKLELEKEHPEIYGKHGSSRHVSETEFWGKENIKLIKAELQRRKSLNLIKSSAGLSRAKVTTVDFKDMYGRHHCELCGAKLSQPETDLSKTAVCNKCIKKQYN
jgi:hypothetical protein